MKAKYVLGMLVAFTLVAGGVDARETATGVASQGWSLASMLVFSFLIFWWYRLDSDARGYRRSLWLNVGVVMLAIAAVPYYLVRSRPSGQKARGLLRLGSFMLLLIAAALLGAAIYGLS